MTNCKNCLPARKEKGPDNNNNNSNNNVNKPTPYRRCCNMFLNNSILDANKLITDLLPGGGKNENHELVEEIEEFLDKEDKEEIENKKEKVEQQIIKENERIIINKEKKENKIKKTFENDDERLMFYFVRILVIAVAMTLFNYLKNLFNLTGIFDYKKSKKKYTLLWNKLESFFGDQI